MPFPPPSGANTFGLGASAGTIVAFTQQPTDFRVIAVAEESLPVGGVIETSLPDYLIFWDGLTSDQFEEINDHVVAAKAAGGAYWARVWWPRIATPAYTTFKCNPNWPTHGGIENQEVFRVELRLFGLGIA